MATMIRSTYGHIFIIAINACMQNNLFVGCTCFQDVFLFFQKDSACEFKRNDLTTLIDDKKKCLIDCSMDSKSLLNSKVYELEKMTITFTKSKLKFVLEKPCGRYDNEDVYVNVTCEGKYLYGENCINDEQCKTANNNSVCNSTTEKCDCEQGYIWNLNTCLQAIEIGKYCETSEQCLEVNPNFTCNVLRQRCECKEGFVERSDSCLPGRVLINEMCASYLNSEIDQEMEIDSVCSRLALPSSNLFKDTPKTDQPAIIVGVGLAGILLGILGCLAVLFIRNRHEKNNVGNKYAEERLQISEDMNSTAFTCKKRTGEPEETGIYNHLGENAIELHDQSDYDHCQPQAATDDTYSHLASGYNRAEDSPGDYGEVN